VTDRDPDLQRALDEAIARVRRRLAGCLIAGFDAEQVARLVVEEDLHAHRWWPHPEPLKLPGWSPGVQGAAPTPEYLALKARLKGDRDA
jgi:hypothetical protein